MTIYIYARVSTDDQNLEAQLLGIREKFPTGILRVEKESAVKKRPVFEALLAELKPADTLVVYSLDRLGRSFSRMATVLEELLRKNIHIISMKEALDFTTAANRAFAHMLIVFAELERGMNSERTKKGIDAKKAKGLPFRTKRKFPLSLIAEALKDIRDNGLPVSQAARKYRISRQYLYDCMKQPLPN